ncbi:MAG: sialidase family protein [Clostridiaceae bacterium]|nr:sialidase family protein [Clostridiaceae bacterium]
MNAIDNALRPMTLIVDPKGKYADENRLFQGIPTVERTPNGRLWAAFYGGGTGENLENYVLVQFSDDDGLTWNKRLAVDMPGVAVRAYDPCLWLSPSGALWLFWAQTACVNCAGWNPTFDGRCGVWRAICDAPDAGAPVFGAPERIANGVMMNKPTVTRDGVWLLPCAIWQYVPNFLYDLPGERFSNVYASYDDGKSFSLIGHADYPDRLIDEHMLVQRRDGSLWMLIRAKNGIGEAFSHDGGHTWENARDSGLGGPCSRFFIRRTRSGRLLLVNHYHFSGRNNLTALLSDDDGATWRGGLLLDGRANVSYPDGAEDDAGNHYIIYDRERTGAREILLARVTEDDILAGALVSPGSFAHRVVNKATGTRRFIACSDAT